MRTDIREETNNMNMRQLNNPLRNTLETIRISREDALYKIFLHNFFKGGRSMEGLQDEVGVFNKIGYAEAVILTKLKDMPLACQLRRLRINRIK